ncbi:hypothetical protein G4B88_021782 [Cannabis sativa]|uniref:Uncharacterized protein n=1 Tax=Cannabis sativa TaxID=3483 RepID=A0A7J6F2S2_CANSA|nr:hypothetical protein G4B88_021782 [Cannabis sativa]
MIRTTLFLENSTMDLYGNVTFGLSALGAVDVKNDSNQETEKKLQSPKILGTTLEASPVFTNLASDTLTRMRGSFLPRLEFSHMTRLYREKEEFHAF